MKIVKLLLSFLSILALHSIFSDQCMAQRPYDSVNLDTLKRYEMRLEAIGDSMVDGSTQAVRVHSLKRYIPTLVEALKTPGSFDYPFDSLKYMYTFTPPDRRFRLYNWHINFIDNTFRFYGVLQMNNKDSLELYPFYDRVEDALLNAEDTVLGREGWYGAQYFELIQKTINDKKHYFLLGWDGFNNQSNRKLIDVMTFNDDGEPIFGAPVFKHEGVTKKRVIFIYNNDATMQMEYNPDKNAIAYDHLVPPNERAVGKEYTYIPDGTYDYFLFKPKEGIWIQKDTYFDQGFPPAMDAQDNQNE